MVSPTPQGKKVLIVEDDPFLLKAYQAKFAREGFETLVARDGKEALAFLEKEPPHLVLLDLMLPYVSGFDILSAIRKNSNWKDVPVVVATNLSQEPDFERAKKLGATDFIIKSETKVKDLVEKVRKLLA